MFINGELCKKLKFEQITKWCIHKPESVQENEIHKIFWDFEIQTDPLIPDRRTAEGIILKSTKTKRETKD